MLAAPSLTQRIHENPLLYYAWQAFFLREIDEELREHRIAVKKSVPEFLKDRISENLTFEYCCKSDLMNETLWSSAEWLLYLGPRTETPAIEARREGVIASLIEYDCRQNLDLSLQDTVNRHCRLQEKSGLVARDNASARVLYHLHAENPNPFSDLPTFNLPLLDNAVATDGQSTRVFWLSGII
ncbi:hypothetical protein FBEOM_5916 [Fusarium beomiforme]|uniref:Uncharacterized protein n=1 Tax=Fusarium beomiforme TaxID=44412 RepID=A0A9P5AKL3_9HYPO|nr:hypothetical protein FBEOM_5916 [Fusarium beomiforme]